jgi:hypothetical protein
VFFYLRRRYRNGLSAWSSTTKVLHTFLIALMRATSPVYVILIDLITLMASIHHNLLFWHLLPSSFFVAVRVHKDMNLSLHFNQIVLSALRDEWTCPYKQRSNSSVYFCKMLQKLWRNNVESEVLTAVVMKSSIFWDITLCRMGGSHSRGYEEFYLLGYNAV